MRSRTSPPQRSSRAEPTRKSDAPNREGYVLQSQSPKYLFPPPAADASLFVVHEALWNNQNAVTFTVSGGVSLWQLGGLGQCMVFEFGAVDATDIDYCQTFGHELGHLLVNSADHKTGASDVNLLMFEHPVPSGSSHGKELPAARKRVPESDIGGFRANLTDIRINNRIVPIPNRID